MKNQAPQKAHRLTRQGAASSARGGAAASGSQPGSQWGPIRGYTEPWPARIARHRPLPAPTRRACSRASPGCRSARRFLHDRERCPRPAQSSRPRPSQQRPYHLGAIRASGTSRRCSSRSLLGIQVWDRGSTEAHRPVLPGTACRWRRQTHMSRSRSGTGNEPPRVAGLAPGRFIPEPSHRHKRAFRYTASWLGLGDPSMRISAWSGLVGCLCRGDTG